MDTEQGLHNISKGQYVLMGQSRKALLLVGVLLAIAGVSVALFYSGYRSVSDAEAESLSGMSHSTSVPFLLSGGYYTLTWEEAPQTSGDSHPTWHFEVTIHPPGSGGGN